MSIRDEEFSTAFYCRALREKAKEEAIEDDFGHPEEYTWWLAANRLEDLEAVIECLDPEGNPSANKVAALLKRIAGSIEYGKAHHIYTYKDDEKED